MNWQEHIILDPNVLVGKPVVKGTRLSVEFLVNLLAEGWTEGEILRNYPGVTREDMRACLASAVIGLGAHQGSSGHFFTSHNSAL